MFALLKKFRSAQLALNEEQAKKAKWLKWSAQNNVHPSWLHA